MFGPILRRMGFNPSSMKNGGTRLDAAILS